uniref:Olfactory receptor n=1 Tax=Leptobrachium leishanense TaxID=445787 RepID=A0A8C5PUE1_9ANUR
MSGNEGNNTFWKEFHILAFSNYIEYQFVLFMGALVMYIFSMFGNLILIIVVILESQLHTPMYFFLCNLSVQDILYVSAILPKLLAITVSEDTRIGFQCCIMQMFLFAFCVGTEFFLLTAMSYDRYVAICVPLHYALIMNKKMCFVLASISWFLGALNSLMHSLIVANLSFCKSQEIDHVFCDVKTLLRMSCSETSDIHVLIYVEGIIFGLLPFFLIITSYVYIISRSILRIKSVQSRKKAFSTCTSHLTVLLMFYVTVLCTYMGPASEHSERRDQIFSILYTAVTPMLNPVVYSLRNNEVKGALKRILRLKK